MAVCGCGGQCGQHFLVLTIHAEGWMAGCHCKAAFKMPQGFYAEKAEREAERLFAEHRRGAR